MVTINTNLSSLIVQNNLTKSTSALNLAIERMTTGCKINHASDNAANYSIANNYSAKLSSYNVASDNVAMGLDLLATAQDSISLMQRQGERLMALWTEAQNGTYGEESLNAINSEVKSLIAEINRTYKNTEYNGISLLSRNITLFDGLKEAGESGFIDESEETWGEGGVVVGLAEEAGTTGTVGLESDLTPKYNGFISDPTAVDEDGHAIDVGSLMRASDIDVSTVEGRAIYNSTSRFQIDSKSDLEALANLVNTGTNTAGKTFILNRDIDLGAVAEDVTNWTPIGYYTSGSNHQEFKGTFDGNGHKITNLSINESSSDYQGLFGGQLAAGVTIKNVGVEGRVKGKQYSGGLVSYLSSYYSKKSSIENCYSNVEVKGTGDYTGGLVGRADGVVTNSYATGNVTGTSNTGGLVGQASENSTVTNSYATGDVTGKGNSTGGLVGLADMDSTVTNSYATGVVTGTGNFAGGLVGFANSGSTVNNSYATGNVTGESLTGGLVGHARGAVTNSYATGIVTGDSSTGGLVGYTVGAVTNSYATGNVTGTGDYTGGLVGNASGAVTNSYATGVVTGTRSTGGLVGYTVGAVSNSYTTGNVTGTGDSTGGLVGEAYGEVSNSYAAGIVTGTRRTGGLVGWTYGAVTNSYARGNVTGTGDYTGGLAGYASNAVSNSYATGNVTGTADSTGGLVGYASNAVSNSYATGNVTGTVSTGGLVGCAGGAVTSSYATGNVTGTGSTGGLVGYAGMNSTVTNSYTTGMVSGTDFVGGIAGQMYNISGSKTWTNAVSYSVVKGNDKVGSLVGGVVSTIDGSDFGEITFTDCKAINQGLTSVGGEYKYASSTYAPVSHGIDTWLESIEGFNGDLGIRTIQVGIYGDTSSSIDFFTNVNYSLNQILYGGIKSRGSYEAITGFMSELSTKATELGAASNRLESALESISVNIDNLTSSRSTIKDADISKVSSDYIRHQILQQASATLLATANQSPSIALQLI